MWRPRGGSL
jgi:hypothetical protein